VHVHDPGMAHQVHVHDRLGLLVIYDLSIAVYLVDGLIRDAKARQAYNQDDQGEPTLA